MIWMGLTVDEHALTPALALRCEGEPVHPGD